MVMQPSTLIVLCQQIAVPTNLLNQRGLMASAAAFATQTETRKALTGWLFQDLKGDLTPNALKNPGCTVHGTTSYITPNQAEHSRGITSCSLLCSYLGAESCYKLQLSTIPASSFLYFIHISNI